MAQVSHVLRDKGATVHTTTPSTTVFEAIGKMVANNVGALVVVAGGEVRGIVTERDYLRHIALEGRSSKTTPVSDIMSRRVFGVSPSTDVAECLAIMTEGHFRHLPILEQGQLVGIVSVGDLVKRLVHDQSVHIGDLTHYICGTYPR